MTWNQVNPNSLVARQSGWRPVKSVAQASSPASSRGVSPRESGQTTTFGAPSTASACWKPSQCPALQFRKGLQRGLSDPIKPNPTMPAQPFVAAAPRPPSHITSKAVLKESNQPSAKTPVKEKKSSLIQPNPAKKIKPTQFDSIRLRSWRGIDAVAQISKSAVSRVSKPACPSQIKRLTLSQYASHCDVAVPRESTANFIPSHKIRTAISRPADWSAEHCSARMIIFPVPAGPCPPLPLKMYLHQPRPSLDTATRKPHFLVIVLNLIIK
jgi:hypothetical protein